MESVFKGALPSTSFVVAYLRVLFCPRARENARCDAGVAQRTPTISTRALRFVYVEGQSKHAMEHGKQVLKAMLANKHLPWRLAFNPLVNSLHKTKTPRYLTKVCVWLELAWPGNGSAGLGWPGLAWPRLGLAWPGLTWPGLAWTQLAWPGLAWPGLVWPGRAWLGLGWPSLAPFFGLW